MSEDITALAEKLANLQAELNKLQASEPKDTERGIDLESKTGGALTEEAKAPVSETASFIPDGVEVKTPNAQDLQTKINKVVEFIGVLGAWKVKAERQSKDMVRDITLRGQDKAQAELFQWIIDSLNERLK